MCEPMTMAAVAGGGGVAAGTASAASAASMAIKGISAIGQAASARRAAEAQNKAYAQNAASARDAYFLKSKQANLRVVQEQTQASQQKMDADLKAMRSQGTAIAASAGAGVEGANVAQLINDFERSEGVLTDRISQRLEGMQAQNENDKLGFQSEAINRINSMQPASFTETLFNVVEPIAGFGIDYYDTQARLATV